MLREIPCFEAITATAPPDRFKVRAILSMPTFFFANPLSVRMSTAVQGRRTRDFFLTANLPLHKRERGVLPIQPLTATNFPLNWRRHGEDWHWSMLTRQLSPAYDRISDLGFNCQQLRVCRQSSRLCLSKQADQGARHPNLSAARNRVILIY